MLESESRLEAGEKQGKLVEWEKDFPGECIRLGREKLHAASTPFCFFYVRDSRTRGVGM